MPELFDAAVVGGGPAGATAAMCLARLGWKVCLFEAAHFRSQCSGETLPPEIAPLLRRLGVFEAFLATSPLESPGIVSVWGGSDSSEHDFVRSPHGPGWHVDRNRLDEMLSREAAAAGAVYFPGCRAEVYGREAGAWRLGGVRAKFLIDASGRRGAVLRGAREIDDRLVAIVLKIEYPQNARRDMRAAIESAPAGWWYSAPLPGKKSVATFFTGSEVYTREGIVLDEQLRGSSLMRERLRGACVSEIRKLYAPSWRRRTIAGETWLSVGDSACCYDPLSGRGVYHAISQGERAASALHAHSLEEYDATARAEFEDYRMLRRAYYASERRWAHLPFWRRRGTDPDDSGLGFGM